MGWVGSGWVGLGWVAFVSTTGQDRTEQDGAGRRLCGGRSGRVLELTRGNLRAARTACSRLVFLSLSTMFIHLPRSDTKHYNTQQHTTTQAKLSEPKQLKPTKLRAQNTTQRNTLQNKRKNTHTPEQVHKKKITPKPKTSNSPRPFPPKNKQTKQKTEPKNQTLSKKQKTKNKPPPLAAVLHTAPRFMLYSTHPLGVCCNTIIPGTVYQVPGVWYASGT